MKAPRLLVPLLAALLLLSCGGSPGGVRRAMGAAQAGDLDAALALLEREKQQRPDDFQVRLALGVVHYRIARATLDGGGDEARYLANLESAVDELVTAASLNPTDSEPHFWLAVIDVYRDDLESALRGFQNVHRLRPSGISRTNLGEIYVYLGDLEKARRWSVAGMRNGSGAGPAAFNTMLIHWRSGDLEAAERNFETLWTHYPEYLATINGAPVPREPDSFEEFAGYCCGSPACGPYLEKECRAMGLKVESRHLSEEAVLEELRIEMEKRRRLGEIYQDRRLEVEVEEPEE
jgi:Flp pilus assembly protein TadD